MLFLERISLASAFRWRINIGSMWKQDIWFNCSRHKCGATVRHLHGDRTRSLHLFTCCHCHITLYLGYISRHGTDGDSLSVLFAYMSWCKTIAAAASRRARPPTHPLCTDVRRKCTTENWLMFCSSVGICCATVLLFANVNLRQCSSFI